MVTSTFRLAAATPATHIPEIPRRTCGDAMAFAHWPRNGPVIANHRCVICSSFSRWPVTAGLCRGGPNRTRTDDIFLVREALWPTNRAAVVVFSVLYVEIVVRSSRATHQL